MALQEELDFVKKMILEQNKMIQDIVSEMAVFKQKHPNHTSLKGWKALSSKQDILLSGLNLLMEKEILLLTSLYEIQKIPTSLKPDVLSADCMTNTKEQLSRMSAKIQSVLGKPESADLSLENMLTLFNGNESSQWYQCFGSAIIVSCAANTVVSDMLAGERHDLQNHFVIACHAPTHFREIYSSAFLLTHISRGCTKDAVRNFYWHLVDNAVDKMKVLFPFSGLNQLTSENNANIIKIDACRMPSELKTQKNSEMSIEEFVDQMIKPQRLDISSTSTSNDENDSQDSIDNSEIDSSPPRSSMFLRSLDYSIKSAKCDNIHFTAEYTDAYSESTIKMAENELVTLTLPLNIQNSECHHSFGAAIAGHIFRLFFFEQKQGNLTRHLIYEFNMYRIADRLKLITNVIQMYYIISVYLAPSMNPKRFDKNDYKRNYLPVYIRSTNQLQYLRNETTLLFDSVLKMVDLDLLATKHRLPDQQKRLEDFYSLIMVDKESDIKNSLRCREFTPLPGNKLRIILTPLGRRVSTKTIVLPKDTERFIRDVGAFLDSIHKHKFAHTDIRLDNIVEIDGIFTVIDYENIQSLCEINEAGYCATHHSNFDGNRCITFAHDFMRLARILATLNIEDEEHLANRAHLAIQQASVAFIVDQKVRFNAESILKEIFTV